jgi:ornithine cyclodeaminase/alanine dehydrogenase-like protein (mu-crystallin family)
MDVLIVNRAEVERLLDPAELLRALADGFRALSAGRIAAPERNELALPGEAFLLGMPGHRRGGAMAVKVVTVYESNLARGLPSHLATIGLYDPETGACTAFIDGTHITALRTSAAAALATGLLARQDAHVFTLIGAGVQGEHHLATFPLVRDFAEIRIASLVYADAERLAATHPRAVAVSDVRAAVVDADVVALATHAGAPVIEPIWLRPGTHVSSVGYRPPDGELPRALARDHRLFVESRLAFRPTPAGCAELAGLDPARATELGEILLGTRPGRTSPDEITVYKAMGHVIEDIAAAELVVAEARRTGAGRLVRL